MKVKAPSAIPAKAAGMTPGLFRQEGLVHYTGNHKPKKAFPMNGKAFLFSNC
jgi:hypothetical protein